VAEVVPLRFRVLLRRASLRTGHVERLLAEDQCEYLRRTDRELGEWLDENAPGWGVELEPVGYVGRELPIGEDEYGTFIVHDKFLTFSRRADADAFGRHIREGAERIKRLRAERASLDPSVEERCTCCRGPMEEGTTRIAFHCGPIEFGCEIPCLSCPECDGESYSLSDYGFSDLAREEMRRWLDDEALREARALPVFETINVPYGADRSAVEALVTPAMERWSEWSGLTRTRPSPVPEGGIR